MSRVLIEAIIAAKQSFANISITKWSCANKFYVLIGSTICFFLWKANLIFFWRVSQAMKLRKAKNIIKKSM